MNIAVTGASGQLGRAIIQAIREQLSDCNLIGLARTPEKARDLDVDIRPGDYGNYSQLESSLAGMDQILLVSGMEAPDKRIDQHRNVIRAAKAVGVKKIVYTSIQGAEQGTAFSPVVQSNRQTEADLKSSGLDWVIGRNGLYIEPDVEYIDNYRAAGEIANCAGDGKCGYTTRSELGFAYAKMLSEAQHNGNTYNLHGEALTQTQLAEYLSDAFDLGLKYRSMTVDEYRAERIAELGDFLGTVISGIYQGILEGALDNPSHFNRAAGRPHQSWRDYFSHLKPQKD